jgi:hypothetical protein
MPAAMACQLMIAIGMIISFAGCASPSNHRDWCLEHRVMPHAIIHDDVIEIANLRDFRHYSEKHVVPQYRDHVVRLAEIDRADLFVCYSNSDRSVFAHTMLSFGSSQTGQYFSISVEARREEGEDFGVVNAVTRQLELIYVVATESDMIDLRTQVREETLYRYPIQATPEQVRKLLISLLEDANKLRRCPEFYRLLANNCTSNLLEHVGAEEVRPASKRWIATFPGFSDVILRRLGLIESSQPIMCQRSRSAVNANAAECRFSPEYSRCLRRRD